MGELASIAKWARLQPIHVINNMVIAFTLMDFVTRRLEEIMQTYEVGSLVSEDIVLAKAVMNIF